MAVSEASKSFLRIGLSVLAILVLTSACRQPAVVELETPSAESGSSEADTAESNSSFELLSEGSPLGWTSTEVNGGPGWVSTEKLARTGSKAVMLRGSAMDVDVSLCSAEIPVRAGDAVDFIVWVRPEGQAGCSPSAYVEGRIDGTWKVIEPVAAGAMLRTSKYRIHFEWSPRGFTVFIPTGVSEVRLVLSCSARESSGVTWYADDFTYRVSSFSSYIEAQRGESLPDVFLIGIDTLAQNALGCYGAQSVHTPNIDLLAREGVRFTHVTPASPWTKPSFASILTSLYPSQHGAELINSQLPMDVTTLAEVLREKGYFTAGFVRAPYDGFVGPGMNFNQGFDVYFYANSDHLVFEAIKQFLDTNVDNLRNKKGGLFLFWHFFEPHSTFLNNNPTYLRNKGKAGNAFNNELADISVLDNEELYNEDDRQFIRACYESEVGLVDDQLGDLFRRLKFMGLYDRAHIVLCADHGESFGEKPGVWNHSHPYITCLQTPLIFRFPDGARPAAADPEPDTMASNLDIMPTILAAIGAPVPALCEGRDLFGAHDGLTARYGISEDKALRTGGSIAVRERRYRLVVNKATKWDVAEDWTTARWTLYGPDTTARYELYDLENDPVELKDISGEHPEILARLRGVLDEHAARTGISAAKPVRANAKQEIMQDTLDQLKALGYH